MLEIALIKQLSGASGDFVLEINLKLKTPQIIGILGKSGAGKSTLLRMLAGLERPDSGRIYFNKEVWLDTDKKICLPPQKRSVGFVFQDYGLFPHLNVYQNITFANKRDLEKIHAIIDSMELKGLLKRRIDTLSGGQAQRIALARAILRVLDSPQGILCLDEPLNALDSNMRTKLREEIKYLSVHFNLTTLMITHDPIEAYKMADTLVCIQEQSKRHVCQIKIPTRCDDGLLAKVLNSNSNTLTLMLESQVLSLPIKTSLAHGSSVLLKWSTPLKLDVLESLS
ncbi:ATP-binding cassette domain-containing protein [Helicobacter suis]|uniref:ATP-binding cassette domain-containing protein n=1 Tax=Helicobacter suis TaxID=104628 RepID=UPI0024922CD5|nr:ATP-binding cassette domain-containing protein [Helicobacter suis]